LKGKAFVRREEPEEINYENRFPTHGADDLTESNYKIGSMDFPKMPQVHEDYPRPTTKNIDYPDMVFQTIRPHKVCMVGKPPLPRRGMTLATIRGGRSMVAFGGFGLKSPGSNDPSDIKSKFSNSSFSFNTYTNPTTEFHDTYLLTEFFDRPEQELATLGVTPRTCHPLPGTLNVTKMPPQMGGQGMLGRQIGVPDAYEDPAFDQSNLEKLLAMKKKTLKEVLDELKKNDVPINKYGELKQQDVRRFIAELEWAKNSRDKEDSKGGRKAPR
jgi:hypothetical protein